jgi:hypothetical protein
VEVGRVRHAHVAHVPRAGLEHEGRHVPRLREEEQAAAPLAAVLAPEVPRDAAADEEVVPPAVRRPRWRRPEPADEVLGEGVAHVVAEPPQVPADVESRVVGHVDRGGAGGVGGEAAVLPHPVVEDDLEGELVRVVPARGREHAAGARQPRAHAGAGDVPAHIGPLRE